MKVKQILREYKERTPGFFDRRFPGHYAQIATVMTMKLKSAILNVARFTYGRGKIPYDIQGLSGKMEVAPQGISDAKFIFGYEDSGEQKPGSITFDPALQEYVRKYPDQWATVQLCLQLPMAHGKHAAAYLLSNRPLEEFIPNTDRDGMIVTQYEAKAIEALGGIKYDFLLVQTLNIIQRAIALVQGSSGLQIPDVFKTEIGNSPKCNLVPKNGTFYDVWRLPEEPAVFEDISEIRTDTVFQLDTPGVKKWMEYFREKRPDGTYIIDSIDKMAIFTALDRPGVLNMELENPEDGSTHNGLVEYVRRSLGKPDSPSVLPVFRELFPKTEGLVVLQEPLQKAYQYLTGCSGSEADDFRSYIGKKDKEKIMAMYPRFLERATEKLQSKELAQEVWDALNKSADYLFCFLGSQLIQTDKGVVSFDELAPGTKVKSFCGKTGTFEYIEPSAYMSMGEREVLEVTLEDGSVIQATADHKFLYDGAWVCLSDLILLGNVETQQEKKVPMRQNNRKQHAPHAPNLKSVLPSKGRKRKKAGNLPPKDQALYRMVERGRG